MLASLAARLGSHRVKYPHNPAAVTDIEPTLQGAPLVRHTGMIKAS
jgi:hypothetical protein